MPPSDFGKSLDTHPSASPVSRQFIYLISFSLFLSDLSDYSQKEKLNISLLALNNFLICLSGLFECGPLTFSVMQLNARWCYKAVVSSWNCKSVSFFLPPPTTPLPEPSPSLLVSPVNSQLEERKALVYFYTLYHVTEFDMEKFWSCQEGFVKIHHVLSQILVFYRFGCSLRWIFKSIAAVIV